MIKAKVLFLCTTNACRSPIAEAYLKQLGGESFEPHSAGAEPVAVAPTVLDAMREEGFDLSTHVPTDVASYLGERFTYVVHLCNRETEQSCPIFPGAIYRLHWEIENPVEQDIDAVRRVRDEIKKQVQLFVEQHA